MPTIREPDGLALSSRNAYLTPEQRAAAPVVYRALRAAESLWQSGERNATPLQAAALAVLESEPLVSAVDYVSIVDTNTMALLNTVADGQPAMMAMAARLGSVRLIDNVVLD